MAFKTSIGGKQEHNENDKDKNHKNFFARNVFLAWEEKSLKVWLIFTASCKRRGRMSQLNY